MKYCVAVLMSLGVAGCSSGLLGGGGSSGPASDKAIPVGNQLALPPDLALKAPGPTSPTYRANSAPTSTDTGVYSDDVGSPVTQQAALPKATSTDLYEKYGISKLNPDGSKKSEGKLREELRLAILAEKRKTNPNYGTVRNIGNLFND